MADKKADEYLGGMSGKAAGAIRGRQKQIDDAVDSATSDKRPNTNEDKGVDGKGRPEQRKRWYE
jgi:hypothetical protein